MKKPDKYFSTAELMTLDEASLDALEAKGTIDQGRRLAAKYQLAGKFNNRTYKSYIELKAKADTANTEQQEIETLRQRIAAKERELGVTP